MPFLRSQSGCNTNPRSIQATWNFLYQRISQTWWSRSLCLLKEREHGHLGKACARDSPGYHLLTYKHSWQLRLSVCLIIHIGRPHYQSPSSPHKHPQKASLPKDVVGYPRRKQFQAFHKINCDTTEASDFEENHLPKLKITIVWPNPKVQRFSKKVL